MSNTSAIGLTPFTIILSEKDLKEDEGRRDRPYRDSLGHLTIGYGHNLDAEGLCEEALEAQLRYDIRTKAIDPLNRRLPWWRGQPATVQRVLINLSFNMGIETLLTFGTFLALLQSASYSSAAADLLHTKYARQVPRRAKRLAEMLRSVV